MVFLPAPENGCQGWRERSSGEASGHRVYSLEFRSQATRDGQGCSPGIDSRLTQIKIGRVCPCLRTITFSVCNDALTDFGYPSPGELQSVLLLSVAPGPSYNYSSLHFAESSPHCSPLVLMLSKDASSCIRKTSKFHLERMT